MPPANPQPGLPLQYLLIKVAAMAVAATLLLLVAACLGWRFYCDWRLGRVELTNEGTPVTVEVLSESGIEPIGEPIALIRRKVLSLPDGEYRLARSASGRLSRTFRFAVNHGDMLTYLVDLDAGQILGGEQVFDSSKPPPFNQGVPVPPTSGALELARGKRDLFQWSYLTLIRRDATTGLVIWDVSRPAKPYERGRDPAKWLWLFTRGHRELSIVEPAPDLDGDGTGDIVCAFRRVPALLALEPAITARSNPLCSSARLEFILGSVAGIPIVVFAALAAGSLVRRCYRTLAVLVVITLFCSLVIAAGWVWVDEKVLPAVEQFGWSNWYRATDPGVNADPAQALPTLEHYDWSGCSLAIVPGAYAAGVFLLFVRFFTAALRWSRASRSGPD